jgi:hypothetical protein
VISPADDAVGLRIQAEDLLAKAFKKIQPERSPEYKRAQQLIAMADELEASGNRDANH